MDTWHEETKACLGKTETGHEQINAEIQTDLEEVKDMGLEANPEEINAVEDH
jgi:hypothetical protein